MTEYEGPARSPLDEDLVYPLLKHAIDRMLDGFMPKQQVIALRGSIQDLIFAIQDLKAANPEVATKLTAEIIHASYAIGVLASAPQEIQQIEEDQQRKRGRKSGEERAERARRGWMAHARELALAIRQDKPTIAREPLAMEIVLTWKDESSSPKSIRRMVTVLGEMERDGLIPPAQSLTRDDT